MLATILCLTVSARNKRADLLLLRIIVGGRGSNRGPILTRKVSSIWMKSQRSIGWMGLKRGHRARPLEWLAERTIFVVSLIAILMVFLIFVFIGKEALPVLLGRMNTALNQKTIPVEQMDKLSPAELG